MDLNKSMFITFTKYGVTPYKLPHKNPVLSSSNHCILFLLRKLNVILNLNTSQKTLISFFSN